MPQAETFYLQHILDAIARIEDYIQGQDEVSFHAQTLYQDAVIRQIEIIGEATRHLSREFRQKYPHVPWQAIAGMRDKLIHDYFGVDVGEVWLTVQNDIPILKSQVTTILHAERESE